VTVSWRLKQRAMILVNFLRGLLRRVKEAVADANVKNSEEEAAQAHRGFITAAFITADALFRDEATLAPDVIHVGAYRDHSTPFS
jgi:hypothetical protein